MTLFCKNDVFRGGRRTFCPIILEWLNFKERGFRNSDLGSLALPGVYDVQSSNANWGSCSGWLKMQIFGFRAFQLIHAERRITLQMLRIVCMRIVWASGHCWVPKQASVKRHYTARTNMLKLFGCDARCLLHNVVMVTERHIFTMGDY